MANQNKPRSFTPRDGGRLISRADWAQPGFANYVVKRDFRRDLDQEIRREGHDYFHPNLDAEVGDQPWPQRQTYSVSGFTNGGFETDDNLDSVPDGWSVTVGADIYFSISTSAAAGSYAAKFISINAAAAGHIISEDFLPATPGRTWNLTWQHKVSAANFKILVQVLWYDSSQSLLDTVTAYSSTAGNPTAGYETQLATLLVPSTAAYGKVKLHGKDAASSVIGSIWFDAVTLEERENFGDAILLLHQAKRPNGQMAIIAGTEERLYRYRSAGDGLYVDEEGGGPYVEEDYLDTDYILEDTGTQYAEDDYFEEGDAQWEIIGSGFDADGSRWEAININGYTIFNNAVDLPQTFRVEESAVKPNYEMREAGVVSVGTIAEFNGIMMCGDVAILKEEFIEAQFAHESGLTQRIRQHGSMVSYPHTIEAGTTGGNIRYDGNNDTVTVPFSASLNVATTFTIEAWVKFDAWSGAAGSSDMLAYRTAAAPFHEVKFGLRRTITGGPINLFFNRDTSVFGTDLLSSHSLSAEAWNHIAVTTTSGGSILYVNGVESGSYPTHSSTATSPNGWALGMGGYLGPAFEIAEMRIWSVYRTATQIADNMTADVTGQTGLKGYWKFDDAAGLSAVDSSGNANTGTLVNGPTWVSGTSPVDSYLSIKSFAAITNGLTRSGATATMVTTGNHKLVTGDLVLVSGASGTEYNGLFTVTVTSPVSFTYAVSGTPATPDAGTPIVQRALFGAATFNFDAMAGMELFGLNGYKATIASVINAAKIRVNESVGSWTGDHLFRVRNDAITVLTGTAAKNGTTTVTGSSTLFTDELYPGASILIPGGTQGDEVRVVAAIASNTSLTVTDAFDATASGQVLTRMSDYLLLSETDYFTVAMEGKHIFFTDGLYRKITRYVNERWVETSYASAAASQAFLLENITAYDSVTNAARYDRVQYRCLWSSVDEPLRWAAATPGSMELGSRILELQYQARSYSSGDEIVVVGAGTNGGNLAATILWVHPNHTTILLNTPARTTVVEQPVSRADAIGSMSGYDDLQSDGSTIIKMAGLRGTLVVYHDNAIFFGSYTGSAAAPFVFVRRVERCAKTPFYRDTLVSVNGEFHLYAGRNSFYRFDLVSQVPREFEPWEMCSDLFFGQATLTNTKRIHAFDNALTKEIFLCYPSGISDKGLCFDYQFGTASTTGETYTAGLSVKKPQPAATLGTLEDWCILGGANGVVMRYGKSDVPDEAFGGMAIFNRLGSGYTSTIKSGLYGDRFHETRLTEWMAELSTHDYPTVTTYTFNLYGYSNSAKLGRLIGTAELPDPATENLVPMLFNEHFFQDEIVVTGANNPLRLAARTVAFGKVASRGKAKAGLT